MRVLEEDNSSEWSSLIFATHKKIGTKILVTDIKESTDCRSVAYHPFTIPKNGDVNMARSI
jgi:hypothetical protein